MPSMKSITDSIESISVKKENLRKAFEDLQSHSSSLTSFTLQWKDIETHFDSIEKSIKDSFKDLESKLKNPSAAPAGSSPEKPQQSPEEESTANERESSAVKESRAKKPAKILHPELKSFCAKMDGRGLFSYLIANRKDLTNLRLAVGPALSTAADPAKLVLDAMEGFQSINLKEYHEGEMSGIRRTSIVLLERLMSISPEIKSPAKEQATKLAMEWKKKISESEVNVSLEGLGFLQLLATYGLVSAYDVDEVLGAVVTVCSRKHSKNAISMCRWLGLTDKIPDLIQKLISNGKQVDAVDFIYAFDLAEKFPPVPLLKAYIKASKKASPDLIKKGKNPSQNEAKTKVITAVRAVIKCVKEHKLESKYPIVNLQKRVTELEMMMAANKRAAKTVPPAANKRAAKTPPSKPAQQPAKKKLRRSATTKATTVAGPTTTIIPPIQQQTQPHLMADLIQPYLGSSVPSFGYSMGPSTANDRPGSSSILGTAPVDYGQARSYPSDAAMASGFYDRPLMGYGGYPGPAGYPGSAGLPQPHQPPSYYQ